MKATLLGNGQAAATLRPTNNPQAYEFYLQGKYLLNQRIESLTEASRFFEEAIELDVAPYPFMIIYGSLREKEKAFSYLKQCFEEREPWLIGLKRGLGYEDLRSSPRFEEYVERMNFPEK